ncbi:hypothetical protein ACMU_14650 [Actibacterium mucosum KCTC 23349]|uniref:Uncharacterized protein n=1 Tax=Actibacterium mucosum KCTC 23349 TaxID=1454373 RepID=A0A037ZJK9_9RHOB|nr:hypothetical protein ACMU_14650 [Actibacterium mucosum KCTC 23349]
MVKVFRSLLREIRGKILFSGQATVRRLLRQKSTQQRMNYCRFLGAQYPRNATSKTLLAQTQPSGKLATHKAFLFFAGLAHMARKWFTRTLSMLCGL